MNNILRTVLQQRNNIAPEKMWPEQWKTIHYKIYERCKTFFMKDSVSFAKSLGDLNNLLLKRKSAESFTGESLELEEVLGILRYAAGTQNITSTHRTYASGGALYPIEIYYINVLGTKSFIPGIYHFNPKDNSFSFMKKIVEKQTISNIIGSPYTTIDQAAGVICFTAIPNRTTDKYGWLGIRSCFFDIGQIIQNLSLLAETLHWGYRPIAGFSNEKVEALLQIDGHNEVSLLTYVIGHID